MLAVYTKAKNGYYYHGMRFTAVGDVIPTHRHASYRHKLKCAKGLLQVWDEQGGEVILRPGQVRTIPAGVAHELKALEPDTFACCVHRLYDEKGNFYPFDYQLTNRELVEATKRL